MYYVNCARRDHLNRLNHPVRLNAQCTVGSFRGVRCKDTSGLEMPTNSVSVRSGSISKPLTRLLLQPRSTKLSAENTSHPISGSFRSSLRNLMMFKTRNVMCMRTLEGRLRFYASACPETPRQRLPNPMGQLQGQTTVTFRVEIFRSPDPLEL